MAKDPYKLLGVKRSATEAEIRKAYRALAKKLHPDVNPGDEKTAERFKEVTAAYNLLSDKDLRARYDSGQVDASGQQQNPFGSGGFGQNPFGRGGGQDDMADLFSSLFGMNMGGMNRNRGGYARPQKGADVRYKLKLSFIEALTGGSKKIKTAEGNILSLKIPEGVEEGKTLRLRGKGQPGAYGGPAGDAKIDISVGKHKYFQRDGKHLRLTLPISLREAILGGKIKIPMPGGPVQLNLPAGTNSGKTLRLKGKGIKGGDLLVTIQIVIKDIKNKDLESWAQGQNADEANALRSKLL